MTTSISKLVLLGASGDLAGRFVLPALAALREAGALPDDFTIVGAARQGWDDEAFRRHAAERIAEHGAQVSAAARDALVRSLRYQDFDLEDPATLAPLLEEPAAIYLALPGTVFSTAVRALGEVGLPPGSRIAVEKPFGDDLASARALDADLERAVGDAGEEAIFRVDHVLGMTTVHDLIAMRVHGSVFEPLWSGEHIERVELRWDETIGLEGRASFYDQTGALKDVVQNHVLQLLALLAMEPPAGLEVDLPARKLEVLRATRALASRRARYTAGTLAEEGGAQGQRVPDYTAEEKVDPARCTETFAELTLEVGTARWAGTRFVIRAGKALRERRKDIVIRFRDRARSELRMGIDGPEDLSGARAGADAPRVLRAPPPPSKLPAYARVLRDLLSRRCTLSVRGDEAEASWRVVEPVMRAWAAGAVPLEEYAAGSDGPPRRAPSREAELHT